MTDNVLVDPAPLSPQYLPAEFVDREDEQAVLTSNFSEVSNGFNSNLHLHGPRGTGKTHTALKILQNLPDKVTTAFIPSTIYDTEYKALQELGEQIFEETIQEGYHTSKLQRRIEERTQTGRTVVVLDEIDFLLMNDGDDLLYYLSRLKSQKFSVITISAHYQDLQKRVEERTYSSLQPQRIGFEPYSAEQIFQILLSRARKALKPRSLQRSALTYIASTTPNIQIGLTWLRQAAQKAESAITESVVREVKQDAYQSYVNYLLKDFTPHHHLIYETITQLSEDNELLQTGEIYTGYKDICKKTKQDPLSNRRISDYLKHLELLDLITADYHYGGSKGKTRDIRLNNQIPDKRDSEGKNQK